MIDIKNSKVPNTVYWRETIEHNAEVFKDQIDKRIIEEIRRRASKCLLIKE